MAWNTHKLLSGVIGCVNPMRPATIQSATGYTVNPDGTQVPIYTTASESIQIQPMSTGEIQHMLGMNIQGVSKKIYASGTINAVIRASGKGGDIITFQDDHSVWLVVTVLESWPDWCCVAVSEQLS
jgi:hypothetical protein